MNIAECIHFLEQEVGFASRPGLERIGLLCDKLDNPQDKLTVIHVAGTNGKGSAAAMLSSILLEAGYRVGTYTSPHLERYHERFLINGVEISDEAFAREISLMKEICLKLKAEGKEMPTLFEIITAAAFHYFSEQHTDIVLLEVGLGGRYDATNVVKSPLLSLIMSISIDHTDFLGHTLAEIAAEKAGIIKKNCPVVLYPQEKIVYNIVKDTALAQNAPLFCPQNAEITVLEQTLKGTRFSVKDDMFTFSDVFLPLLGSYQIQNCVTVLQACAVLRQKGLALPEEAIRDGLKTTHWAGRMEICGEHPLILLDGAHNTDGILQLAHALSIYFPGKKMTLVLGVLGDKEYQKMVAAILPFANCVILTEPQNERKLDLLSLSHTISGFQGTVYMEKEIPRAYEKAFAITPKDGVILCCGSLYMIGAIRSYISHR